MMRFVREEDLIKAIMISCGNNGLQELNEEILAEIDHITIGQDDITVVWKGGDKQNEASQLAEGF